MSIPLLRYLIRNYVRSYRYFPPFAVFLVWVMFLYMVGPNPVLDSFAVTASVLFFISAWINYSFYENEDAVQEMVTILHVRHAGTYLFHRIMASFLISLTLATFAIVYPLLLNRLDGDVSLISIIIGWVVHMEFALLGLSIAALFNSKLVSKPITAITCILIILAGSLGQGTLAQHLPSGWKFIHWLLPPVYPIIEWMMNPAVLTMRKTLLVFGYPLIYAAILIAGYIRIMRYKL